MKKLILIVLALGFMSNTMALKEATKTDCQKGVQESAYQEKIAISTEVKRPVLKKQSAVGK